MVKLARNIEEAGEEDQDEGAEEEDGEEDEAEEAGESKPDRIRAFNMHTVFFDVVGEPEPTELIQIFHVLRLARNCIIHRNGESSPALKAALNQMNATAKAHWADVNRGALPKEIIGKDKRLALTAEHIVTAFSTTKALGRRMNASIGRFLPPERWARIAVSDFDAQTSASRNSSSWRRKVVGYVRTFYTDAGCTELDIEQAARSLRLWTLADWR